MNTATAREIDTTVHRAYARIEVRAFEDGDRVITGMATTPMPDRMDDIIEPLGATFKNPIPLLHQHDSKNPVGTATLSKATAEGIAFKAKLPKIDDPGPLKDRIDTAWGEVSVGLVRAVSIGFRALDWEVMKNGGIRWTEIEILELSLVTIPANAEATIETIKSYDTNAHAQPSDERRVAPPHSAGTPVKLIKTAKTEGRMNTTEKIKEFEATRAAKEAERLGIQQKALDEDRTKDASEREQFDTLTQEIAALDAELKDLREIEKSNMQKAKPVNGGDAAAGSQSRDTSVVVNHPAKLEKGIEFARFAMCVAAAKGDPSRALALAKLHYPQQQRAISVLTGIRDAGRGVAEHLESTMRIRAAVPAGDTSDATYASPLVAYNEFAGDFIEYLRPRTIIGQVSDLLRHIPFNVHIKGQTTGGTGYWVGEGAPKPVTAFDFNDANHAWTKIACIAVLTDELIRFSNPSAERLVRDALAGAVIERMDSDFVDPAITAVAGVRPASITNGVSAIASSGTDADAVAVDIAALWEAADAANLSGESAFYLTTPTIARRTSLMRNALGQREFADMRVNGGTFGDGIPVIASNYVDEGLFILVFGSEIYFSDDGQVTIDASREASIQMLDNPTNTPIGTTTATSMVSMFQTNSVALRAERFIHWSKRRSTAVALLEDVAWGPTVASA